ncbi:hypothetical protein, partial [Saccharopolyspora erythraea]|uniref:hypothetical protein n=1 Tax=Saccharopolyspora erythraea TaxID=1836 RepID=UPI003B75BB23
MCGGTLCGWALCGGAACGWTFRGGGALCGVLFCADGLTIGRPVRVVGGAGGRGAPNNGGGVAPPRAAPGCADVL